MRKRARAFVGLGANEAEPLDRLADALAALDRLPGTRVAAMSRPRRTPYVHAAGRAAERVAPVTNAVAELSTRLEPEELLQLLHDVERGAGRVRDGRATRALDLDLLAVDDEKRRGALELPHPRALHRAFVLAPWAEIAPLFAACADDGSTIPIATAWARLQAADPACAADHHVLDPLPFPRRERPFAVLRTHAELEAWRSRLVGDVGLVPTMGALHEGHATLVQRAAACTDHVLATLFVNPLQFGAGEDLDRYPRTFEADVELLCHHGAAAVYVPAADDLYGPGFGTYVVPETLADLHEGAVRPGHFRGVLTVVLKLWMRSRPAQAFFAWKDAQQLALVRRMVEDLDLPGHLVACPTRHAADGLALSSRNRYLDASARARAARFPLALEATAARMAAGTGRDEALEDLERRLHDDGLAPDYVDLVHPTRFLPVEPSPEPALLVAAVRVDGVRLLDNRFVADGTHVPARGGTT
ncbi:MAG: pantoate--beta-alanine ligase [Planctomycetota bacterium]